MKRVVRIGQQGRLGSSLVWESEAAPGDNRDVAADCHAAMFAAGAGRRMITGDSAIRALEAGPMLCQYPCGASDEKKSKNYDKAPYHYEP